MTTASTTDQNTLNPRLTRLTTWVGVDMESSEQTAPTKITTDSISLITVDEFVHQYMSERELVAADYLYCGVKEIRQNAFIPMESGATVSFGFSGFMMIKKEAMFTLYAKQIEQSGGAGRLPIELVAQAHALFKTELADYTAFMRHESLEA